MTADQKKKLLWGNKKATAAVEVSPDHNDLVGFFFFFLPKNNFRVYGCEIRS